MQALSLADGQPLEKGKEPLEKGKKRKKHQATVMVDWHNTLEVGNRIPPSQPGGFAQAAWKSRGAPAECCGVLEDEKAGGRADGKAGGGTALPPF